MPALRYEAHGQHPQGIGPAPQIALSDLTLVPYRYRGSDFSEPAEVTIAARSVRLAVRDATALDDPALRYLGAPVSAPAWWIHDYEGDL